MLTVVVPYRNRAALLPRTLRSLAGCGQRPLRLVLVDNGSTDGSRAVCEAFAREHRAPDFSVVLAEERRPGAARARNRGLALCRTEWVYFFDSDDEFDRDFFALVTPQLTDDTDVLALATNIHAGGRTRRRDFRPTADPTEQILTSHLATQSMVLRTDFVRRIGGWDEELTKWDDYELGLRVLLARPRLRWWTERALHTIHVHPDSLTGADFASGIDAELLALRHCAGDIAAPARRDRRALRAALLCRHAILGGHLRREGDGRAARKCEEQARELFAHEPALARLAGRMISRYVSLGGRGAWRMARLFVRLFAR